MDILVLGGTGFISSHLVRKLSKQNYKVTVFNRGKSRPCIKLPDNIEIINGDRDNEEDLINLMQGRKFDVAYDMIAYLPQQSLMAIDVFKGKIGRFIHCSTVSVYMVSNNVQCPVTEDQDQKELMDYFPRNSFGMNYGINKRDCEKILKKAHHPDDFPVTIMRPTFVSGPGDPTMRDWFWIERILDGQQLLVPGSGDYAFQQIYVKDVANAFAQVIEKEDTIGKAYNVASEEIYTLNTYLKKLGKLLDKTPEIVHIDQAMFDKLPVSQSRAGDVFPFNTRRTAVFSLEKIKKDLNFHSTSFNKWMKATIDWYRKRRSSSSIGYDKRDREIKLAQIWKKKYNSTMKDIYAKFK
ncbi:MAG: NAD-dependent epimerase/dehydratase family protein [Candidatus Marinimicrobia bacterium]|nr:NAD-dependent epimerase/dehydratase family protein [Candidatus Neomarinimicrobiota bacterium]